MRPEDLQRLAQPFPPDDRRTANQQLREALGVVIPNAATLSAEILADLSEVSLGVAWWQGHLSQRRRILIGDQLYLSAASIETNLLEARLHQLEALHQLDERGRIPVVHTFVDQVGNTSKVPVRPGSATERLSGHLATLHVVGFFRAVASALDCLGACIVGVLALPERILRAGMPQARDALRDVQPGGAAEQVRFRGTTRRRPMVGQRAGSIGCSAYRHAGAARASCNNGCNDQPEAESRCRQASTTSASMQFCKLEARPPDGSTRFATTLTIRQQRTPAAPSPASGRALRHRTNG